MTRTDLVVGDTLPGGTITKVIQKGSHTRVILDSGTMLVLTDLVKP